MARKPMAFIPLQGTYITSIIHFYLSLDAQEGCMDQVAISQTDNVKAES